MVKIFLIVLIPLMMIACPNRDMNDFSIKLKDNLNHALTNFEQNNHAFILNISFKDSIITQILHRSYVNIIRHKDNSFGFALHLTFHPNSNTDVINHERFKKLEISKQFKLYYYKGIPCYAIDLNKDAEQSSKITMEILKKVYGFECENQLEIKLTDEGPVTEWE